MINIRSEREIGLLREANQIVAETLNLLESNIRVGVTTHELDMIAENYIRSKGCLPAFKGYNGFPAALCVSINDEIVHGIPCGRHLSEGDIVSCDIGVINEGYYGDAARTFPVGKISSLARKLLTVTEDALYFGISQAKAGNRLYDISHAIQSHVEKHGFSVVKVFVGHGVGRKLHEEPQIPNYGKPGRGIRLQDGMVLALEPMVNTGKDRVRILKDGWTAVTEDGSLSAHFEHSIVIRNGNAEVLSVSK